jgi:enoyl-CoA hydratase/carnithine racemase
MSEPGGDTWVATRDDHVAVLEFRGGPRGTMTIAGAAALAALIEERAARPDPPVLVLVDDVLHAELAEVRDMGLGRPIGDWAPWLAAISGIERYPSATVAAIPCQASCGGLELALAADLRIAAPSARLGVLETRMGIMPGAGGTQRLPALVGAGNAALLVLTGETVDGSTAHRMGLVQVLDGDAVTAAVALAERLADRGPRVLAAAKRALAAARTTTTEGFREEGRAFLSLVSHPDTLRTIEQWLERQARDEVPAHDASPLE